MSDSQVSAPDKKSPSIDYGKLAKDIVRLDGHTYYDAMLPPPGDDVPWIIKFYISFYYGKYFQYPHYNKENVDSSKRQLHVFQNGLGIAWEIIIWVVRVFQMFVFLLLTCIFGSSLLLGGDKAVYFVLLILLIPMGLDVLMSTIVFIVKVVIFFRSKPTEVTLVTHLTTNSLFVTPTGIQKAVAYKLKRTCIEDCACDVWGWFLLFRGSGYSFYWNRFAIALCSLAIGIDYMGNKEPVSHTYALMGVYIPMAFLSILELIHARQLYYFQKEQDYQVKIEDVTEKINAGGTDAELKQWNQDRDKFAFRMFKQRWQKWHSNIGIAITVLWSSWGLFSNVNLIMSGGSDAADYVALAFNFIFEILLAPCLMMMATKAPYVTRWLTRRIEKVPLNLKGYLILRYFHSIFTNQMPKLALLVVGTVTNIIGLVSGFLEINKIFDGTNWYRGVFFWLPNWPGLVAQLSAIAFILFYPVFFFVFLLACKKPAKTDAPMETPKPIVVEVLETPIETQ